MVEGSSAGNIRMLSIAQTVPYCSMALSYMTRFVVDVGVP